MRRSFALLIVPVLTVAMRAQTPVPAPTPAFRFERPVVVAGDGPHRLAVDVSLLAGAAPGLKDLRLYNSGGQEVGYLLVGNPATEPSFTPAVVLPIAPTETRTLRTSAFEADLREPMIVDRMRLVGLPAPFLKRIKLEGSGDREHWTLLVADGTLFDLPDDRLQQTELRFTAGSFRYLRLTWDDTNSGRLPQPSAVLAGRRGTIAPPPPLTAPLTFERRTGEPGRSYFRVRLPGGHLPIAALELEVGGGHVMRSASVFEARLSGLELSPVRLGQALLRRVVSGDVAASALRLPLDAPPADSQLDLVLDDGDNAPLDLQGVHAIFSELPWIYFEAPAGSLTARYGNPTLTSPRYDIEATRGQVRIDAVADATWGEMRSRTTDDNAAAAAPPLPTVGSELDTALFRFIRALPAGGAGLVAIPLDAPVLAHSASAGSGFADVRVVDDAGRQVPYVLERASEPLSLDVALERMAAAPKTLPASPSVRSVYRVKWPDRDLPASRLVLTTTARVFNRRISIGIERAADARRRDAWMDIVGRAVWIHADQDRSTPPLAIPVPEVNAPELIVIVEEGDNAPLPIAQAQVLLPSYRVRLFRAENATLRFAYGRKDLMRPQYDLALLAPQVLGTPAKEIALGPEQPPAADRSTSSLLSPRIFWAALGLSALVLVVLIVRLLTAAQPGGQA